MSQIEEILKLPTIYERIEKLKQGRGYRREPNTAENRSDWLIERHEIMDKVKHPDREIVTEKAREVYNQKTGKKYTLDEKKEKLHTNRIALPIEQDIVNIQTAFTVGTEPKILCDAQDDGERAMLSALKFTLKKNRCKYTNKKIVRSWLAEQEVAEYWYTVPDSDNLWSKFVKKVKSFFSMTKPSTRLRCDIWSPFRGDTLYPYFEDENLTGLLRCYRKKKQTLQAEYEWRNCYTLVTQDKVYQWEQDPTTASGYSEKVFNHGFSKLPIIYMWRPEAYCHSIKKMRERIELTLSAYADCVDYHFFPYLVLMGDVKNVSGRLKNHVIEMHGQGASASYLTWNQVPETVKFEVETYLEQIYSMKNTPRISFENLKGSQAPSGQSWHFYFMGAEMAVRNHEEEVGEFLQRRLNFLITALGEINPSLKAASETIDVETEIVPYAIDDLSGRIQTAVAAKTNRIWSNRHAMAFVGNVDRIDEEMKEIMDEFRSDNQMEVDKAVAISQGQAKAQEAQQEGEKPQLSPTPYHLK